MVEADLNNGHVTLHVDLNFTLDLTKTNVVEAIQVMIQLYGADMRPRETSIAFHHTMTYRI